MTASDRATARRYARALFALARERGQAADVRAALESAAANVSASAELRAVLYNPAVSGARKKAIATALWPETAAGADGLVARLLGLLAERHRLASLAQVASAYVALWNAQRQVVDATLVSARELEPAELEGLRGAVRQATGRDVEFRATVDPRVLGGVRLTMEGRVYDGTLRTRLQALRTRLVAGGRHSQA